MSIITLSLNGQSIRFALDDLAGIETVLSKAARRPGQKAFHATSSGRIEALIELAPGQAGKLTNSGRKGEHFFAAKPDSQVVLTDC